jgi:hypothetical protein
MGSLRRQTPNRNWIKLRGNVMEDRSAQIATVCECIDHCFAFAIWFDDFARTIDPKDMVWGLDRGADLVSDATRLQSFLALRKLDDRGNHPLTKIHCLFCWQVAERLVYQSNHRSSREGTDRARRADGPVSPLALNFGR